MDSWEREVRKGILAAAVLAALSKKPMTVHELVEFLESRGIKMPTGTVYPLLKRLERDGMVKSSRRLAEPRPLKEFSLTDRGRRALREARERLTNILKAVLDLLWSSNV